MGTVSRVHTFASGAILTAAQLNNEFDNLLTSSAINGGLDATNLGVTAGQATASKALVVDASRNLADATGSNRINNLALSGTFESTGAITATAGITSGGNIVSDTDSTDDLGTTGVRWANLFVDDVTVTNNVTIGGTLTLTGGITLNGNTTIGDSSADTLTVNSTITSNLIFTDNTYDIGASGATRPRDLHLSRNALMGGTLGVTGLITATGGVSGALTGNVTGNVTGDVTGDVTGNLTGNVTGNVTGNLTGDVTGNISGNVTGGTISGTTGTFSSTLGVTGATTLSSDVGIGTSASATNRLTLSGNQVILASGELKFADATNAQVGTIKNANSSGSQLDFITGGITAMTINSAQDLAVGADKLFVDVSASAVGVGTSSPAGLGARSLNIKAPAANGADLTLEADNGTNFGVLFSGATTNDPFSIYSNTGFKFATASDKNATGFDEHMRLTSAGLLGVGTSLPDGTLHVHTASAGSVTAHGSADDLVVESSADAGLSILTPAANNGRIYFGSPTNNAYGQIDYDHATNDMVFATAGAGRLTVTSAGNVGVNTSSPTEKLTLSGPFRSASQDWQMQIANSDSFAADKGGGIAFGGSYTGSTQTYFSNILGAKENGTNGDVAGYLAFYTRGSGQPYTTERARITSAGLFEVTKSGSAEGLAKFESDNDVSVKLKSTFTSSNGAGIYLEYEDVYTSATNSFKVGIPSSDENYAIGYGTTGSFGPSNVIVSVSSGGNVGIGTSSPVALSNQTSLTVNGTSVGRLDLKAGGGGGGNIYGTGSEFAWAANSGIVSHFYGAASQPMKYTIGSNEVARFTQANGSGGLTLKSDAAQNLIHMGPEGSGGNKENGFITGYANGTQAWAFVASSGPSYVNTGQSFGIGTSSPSEKLHVSGSANGLPVNILCANTYYAASSTDESASFQAEFYQNDVSANRAAGYMRFYKVGDFSNNANASAGIIFATRNAGSLGERARIDASGNFIVGKTTTSANTAGASLSATGGATFVRDADCLLLNRPSTTGAIAAFRQANSEVGTISVTASATAYNTSSDYRLKENVVGITDGITRIKSLKPSRFNFIAEADRTVDGFVAHEVSDIVPEAISGAKDAVDDEGNPQYQGIDQSKLVPLLTAALQEAITKIETLETKVAALEAA